MNAVTHDANADQLARFLEHLKAGRKQQANEVIREMLQTNPSKAGAYALLIGGMLAQNGQYREAIPLYEESIALDPEGVSDFLCVEPYTARQGEEIVWRRKTARSSPKSF